MNRRNFALSTLAALVGCGGGDPVALESNMPMSTGSIVTRVGDIAGLDSETALVVFNGEVLCISFVRGPTAFEATHIEVRLWATGQLLASHPWNGGMGTAIVHNGEIHIFGNTNWKATGNLIVQAVLGQY